MEHRWGSRVGVNVPVTLDFPARSEPGCLVDLSVSGARIRSAARPAPLTFLHVSVMPAHHHARGRPLRIPAHVVRWTPTGFAVEWQALAEPAVRALLVARGRAPLIPVRSPSPAVSCRRAA